MNAALANLFTNDYYIAQLQQKLPYAFEVAEAESRPIQQKRGGPTYETVGPEVGLVREKILVAFLRHTLGDMNIDLPRANTSMRDVMVFGEPLEIKTATKRGKVKAKWTADAESARNDIKSFEFTSDLLLVRIWWGEEKDSVFYIPVETLKDISNGASPADYISGAAGTNNRGIEFAQWFLDKAEYHPNTVRIHIPWQKRNIDIDPMGRWMGYWAGHGGRDPLYG